MKTIVKQLTFAMWIALTQMCESAEPEKHRAFAPKTTDYSGYILIDIMVIQHSDDPSDALMEKIQDTLKRLKEITTKYPDDKINTIGGLEGRVIGIKENISNLDLERLKNPWIRLALDMEHKTIERAFTDQLDKLPAGTPMNLETIKAALWRVSQLRALCETKGEDGNVTEKGPWDKQTFDAIVDVAIANNIATIELVKAEQLRK